METLSYAQLMERCLVAEAERDALAAEMAIRALVTFDDDDFCDAPNILTEFARQLRESKGANHE